MRPIMRPGRIALLASCMLFSMMTLSIQQPKPDPAWGYKVASPFNSAEEINSNAGFYEERRRKTGMSARISAEYVCQARIMERDNFEKGRPDEAEVQACADDLISNESFWKGQINPEIQRGRCIVYNTRHNSYSRAPSDFAVDKCTQHGIEGRFAAAYGAPAVAGLALFWTLVGGQAYGRRRKRIWLEKKAAKEAKKAAANAPEGKDPKGPKGGDGGADAKAPAKEGKDKATDKAQPKEKGKKPCTKCNARKRQERRDRYTKNRRKGPSRGPRA